MTKSVTDVKYDKYEYPTLNESNNFPVNCNSIEMQDLKFTYKNIFLWNALDHCIGNLATADNMALFEALSAMS